MLEITRRIRTRKNLHWDYYFVAIMVQRRNMEYISYSKAYVS